MPPGDYLPQLASLTKAPPSGDQWLHEIKMDGYRTGCLIENSQVRLLSRNGQDWTTKFPEIVEAARNLGHADALLDGELVVLLPDGRTSFDAMQQAAAGRAARVRVVYFVFDLLRLDGEAIDRLPLEQRKQRLLALVGRGKGRIRYTDHFHGRGEEFFGEACRLGLEGIVSKRRDLPYQPGRRDGWRKTKCLRRGLFVIGGFAEQDSGGPLGSLLIGRYDGARLVFCGRVGTGFSQALALDLRARLDKTARRTCPFDPRPAGPIARGAHWVEPKLVCDVTYIEWTDAKMLRHPSFQALRPAIAPHDVVVSAT